VALKILAIGTKKGRYATPAIAGSTKGGFGMHDYCDAVGYEALAAELAGVNA